MKLRKKHLDKLYFSKYGVAVATIKDKKRFVFEDGRILKIKNLSEKRYHPFFWLGDKGIVKLEDGFALVNSQGEVDRQRYKQVMVNERLFPDQIILIDKYDSFSLWNGKNYRQSFQCKDGPNSAIHFEIIKEVQFDSAVEISDGNWAMIATYMSGRKGILISKELKILPVQSEQIEVNKARNGFVFRDGNHFGRVVIEKGNIWVGDGLHHISMSPELVSVFGNDKTEPKADEKAVKKESERVL